MIGIEVKRPHQYYRATGHTTGSRSWECGDREGRGFGTGEVLRFRRLAEQNPVEKLKKTQLGLTAPDGTR